MNLTGHTILVTGASGTLGTALTRRLIDSGATVSTLQRRPTHIPQATDHQGSITDPTTVRQATHGVDTIIHLAAKVSVSGELKDYEKINIEGTQTVLDAAHAADVQRFIHISSPSVAHTGESIIGAPAAPADPERARGHYARTKAAGERLALAADSEDFRVLVLRPHLMWGPGDAQLTERIISRSQQGRMPIIGPGTPLIDTLYLTNAVDALVAAINAVDTHHGESLVLTNGQPRPVGELIRGLARAGGAPEPTLRLPAPLARAAGSVIERIWERLPEPSSGDGEPPLTHFLAEQLSTAHWFDQRRTREVLQWEPSVSIEEGLVLTQKHYQHSS